MVDDEREIRCVASGFLGSAGYVVREADSDVSALAMIEEAELGAAFIDLTMPGVSGHEVAKAPRQRLPDLPIVMMSGFDRDDSLRQLHTDEAFHFIQKRFNRDQLIDGVTRSIRG